ncbi:unnamed protein product [Orchesella dallaii]|uniref:Uncharacterized protein n=1 Tax=Orchesella dallaii TaxID=48710 RepID=A0ABP1RVE5_9HEXA
MLCSCCPKSSKAFVLIAIAIWIELSCGLAASVWTVLFNDKEQSASLNWVFVITTLLTLGLFLAVLCYNNDVLVGQNDANSLLHGAFGLYAAVVLIFPLVYMIFSASPLTTELFPFIVLVTMLELGIGLTLTGYTAFFNHKPVNVWAYIIFGIEVAFATGLAYFSGRDICSRLGRDSLTPPLTMYYWACGIFTVKTGGLFVIVWYYNAFVLGQITLSMVFLYSFGLYLFSLYLLTLVKCIPDDPNDSDDEGVSKYDVEVEPSGGEVDPYEYDVASNSSTQNALGNVNGN